VPVLKIKSASSSVLTGFKGLMLVLIGLFQLILSTHRSSIMLCWWLLVHSGRHPVDLSFIRHGVLVASVHFSPHHVEPLFVHLSWCADGYWFTLALIYGDGKQTQHFEAILGHLHFLLHCANTSFVTIDSCK